MGDRYFTGSGPVSLTGGTPLCTLALGTPSDTRLTLKYLNVSFDGTSASAVPVNVIVARITNTPVNTGVTIPSNYGPNPLDPGAPASVVSALCANSAGAAWSTQPTQGKVLWEQDISPTTGQPFWWPLGEEAKAAVSSWIGVFCSAPAAVTVRTSTYHEE